MTLVWSWGVLVEIPFDEFDVDRPADYGVERGPSVGLPGNVQAFVGQSP
jgi:hypothetical protein